MATERHVIGDGGDWYATQYEDWLAQNISGVTCLDLGSGSGYMSARLAPTLRKIVAVDRCDLASRVPAAGVEQVEADAPTWLKEHPREWFDTIVASEFMEHLSPSDQSEVLTLIANMTNHFIGSMPNVLGGRGTGRLSANEFHLSEWSSFAWLERLEGLGWRTSVQELRECFVWTADKDMSESRYLEIPFGFETELLSVIPGSEAFALLEIGSCDGLDSVKYRRLFPKAVIHAFECDPRNVPRIVALHGRMSGIFDKIHGYALGDKNAPSRFWLSSGTPPAPPGASSCGERSSSLLAPQRSASWMSFREVEVPCYRYDALPDPLYPRFAQLDVQGAELKVLDGFGARLQELWALVLEVSEEPSYAGAPDSSAVSQYLSERGFRRIKTVWRSWSESDQLWISMSRSA